MRCSFAAMIWTGLNTRVDVALPVPDANSTLAIWWPAAVMNLSEGFQGTGLAGWESSRGYRRGMEAVGDMQVWADERVVARRM